MRFAQWVINQIKEHGWNRAEGFIDSDYYVNHDRLMHTRKSGSAWTSEPKERDDWDLFIEYPFWIPSVVLLRGPERHMIRLTRAEKQEFVKLDKMYHAKLLASAKQAKLEKEARAKKAQEWP